MKFGNHFRSFQRNNSGQVVNIFHLIGISMSA